ncbi:MAG TPA: SUF system NifU family Fe-S cluster assembly protein [Gemmatimonadales bacterium]|jgi:nitrogen fixation NifU-like protein|nr:SUF system NifU family Fe-S cluster assembly protein [Gemmatimonadales bacterium]
MTQRGSGEAGSELDELYQSLILDHNRAPRNFRPLENANRHAEGRNPLCGDVYEIWLRLDGDVIAEATFQGQGCAISKASASMMTQAVKGRTVAEARALFDRFHELVIGAGSQGSGVGASTPLPAKLEVFRGVSAFPIRVKCATLSWHAMKAALDGKTE